MTDDTLVGGLRCSQVLENLSAYIDGELNEKIIQSVALHLEACPRCEKFGSEFAAFIFAVKESDYAKLSLPLAVSSRLNETLQSLKPND